jgi:hypothetical protein
MTMLTEEQRELLHLASTFYSAVEAPSEDDMEAVFLFLIKRDEAGLRQILLDSGIDP